MKSIASLDGLDLLGGIVGNLDAEFLFERHHQLDRIEAVGAQIVDEAGIFRDLGLLDAQCSTTIFLTRSAMSLIFLVLPVSLKIPGSPEGIGDFRLLYIGAGPL